MSLSFHLFPLRAEPVAIDALAARASELLRGYVASVPVEQLVDLGEGLLDEARRSLVERAEPVKVTLGAVGAPGDSLALEGQPASFAFVAEPGGGGGLVRRFELGDPAVGPALEAARSAAVERGRLPDLEARLAHGVAWAVERVLGQPPLAVLAHGFVAAALAEEADALVVSADGAWDGELWPCDGKQLAAAFMRPERALCEETRRKAEAMLREVPGALAPFDPKLVGRILDAIVVGLVKEVNAVRGDEPGELAAFDRALDRFDTARLLASSVPVRERDLLLGAGPAVEPRGRPSSALARLRPTPDEYERWLAYLGEHLA